MTQNFWTLNFSASGIRLFMKTIFDGPDTEMNDFLALSSHVAHRMKTEYHEPLNDEIRRAMEYYLKQALEDILVEDAKRKEREMNSLNGE